MHVVKDQDLVNLIQKDDGVSVFSINHENKTIVLIPKKYLNTILLGACHYCKANIAEINQIGLVLNDKNEFIGLHIVGQNPNEKDLTNGK